MSNQTQSLTTFNFETSSIRVIAVNNEPWFVAKDVCDAIGISNSRVALLALDEDEKGVSSTYTSTGNKEVSIISESGMYTLILRCRDAVKKGSIPHRFRKWVTAEVLPQIRKTGAYSKTTTDERTGLRQAVSQLVGKKGLMYSEAYNLVHQRFNVEHIDQLTAEQIPQAVEYVQKIWLEGELIIESPKADTENALDEKLKLRLVSMWLALYHCVEFAGLIEKPLAVLGSPLSGRAYSQATEYQTTLGVMKRLLEPMLADVEVEAFDQPHYYQALKTLREYQPQGLGRIAKI